MQIKISAQVPEKRRGVGFIKSCKSDSQLMDMAEDMIKQSKRRNIVIENVLVDKSGDLDIDRNSINKLLEWVRIERINTLVVHSVFDISDEFYDLIAFLIMAAAQDVTVLSMEENFEVASLPWDGGDEQ